MPIMRLCRNKLRWWWEAEAQPAVTAGGSGGNDLGGRQRYEAEVAVASAVALEVQ